MKNTRVLATIFLTLILFTSCSFISQNKRAILTENDETQIQTEEERSPVIKQVQFMDINDLQMQLHTIAKNETPSVVFISTEKIVSVPGTDFFDFFFRDPRGQQRNDQDRREYKQNGLGSGVIYRQKGNIYYIVTNNHVVEGADTIEITIDQSKIYKGEVINTDPMVDIAVVKIETDDNLVVAKFGNSDNAKVGDFVAAIGNPFGLSGTMTFGIISAVGRSSFQPGNVSLTDFIQTDAAINPGNSGGPLINIQGEVIGINTAIYSRTGGNLGIGFAVPVNVAVKTANQIIDKGKVEHGFLGITYRHLNSDDIKTLEQKNVENGSVIVISVIDGSAAEKAGLEAGDIITEIDGKAIKDNRDFALLIGHAEPGTKLRLKVVRDNKTMTKNVTLGVRPSEEKMTKSENKVMENYGMELAKITPSLRRKYNLSDNLNGVLVTNVTANSRAFTSGIEEGDVIYKINNQTIDSMSDVEKILKDERKRNYIYIIRGKRKRLIIM